MTSTTRDDFKQNTKRSLADRVNHHCSNPKCNAPTSGPQEDADKALNVGVAAHISGAAPGGPRYDVTMTSQQRSSITNGIWLCQTCAKLIDSDEKYFNIEMLTRWKKNAEQSALDAVGKTKPKNPEAQIIDKWVNYDYPINSGIQKDLEVHGYKVCWSSAQDECERVDLQGWERVLLPQKNGVSFILKIRDLPSIGGYLILLKRKILNGL